jgi:hypothetical protein
MGWMGATFSSTGSAVALLPGAGFESAAPFSSVATTA